MTTGTAQPVLYHYWRSSSSWRVRWALELKGIAYQAVAVDLLKGEQRSDAHRQRNPLGMVPVLQIDGLSLAESVAILEYLEETRPTAPLLPREPGARAFVRQLVQIIVADTQPLQNVSILGRIEKLTNAEERQRWAASCIERGFDAYEQLLAQPGRPSGPFSLGSELTMADLCLLPQCYNARRQGLDLARWGRISAIESACQATEAATRSHPDQFKPAG